MTSVGVQIRAGSILPARRDPIQLQTADGLTLIGELARPVTQQPAATLICLHPLPTHGGMMDSHILRKAAWRLPALANVAVLRFNTRGTVSEQGTSEGTFDNAQGERYDVAAAIEYAEFAELPNPWLLGWSFGTDLAVMYGCDPHIGGAILLSPTLRFAKEEHLAQWVQSKKPLVALIPEFDDYLRPAQATERFPTAPNIHLVPMSSGKHLWVGDADRVLNEIVKLVAPEYYPLPTHWDGPIQSASAF